VEPQVLSSREMVDVIARALNESDVNLIQFVADEVLWPRKFRYIGDDRFSERKEIDDHE